LCAQTKPFRDAADQLLNLFREVTASRASTPVALAATVAAPVGKPTVAPPLFQQTAHFRCTHLHGPEAELLEKLRVATVADK